MKSQIDLLLVDSLPGLYSLKHEWDGLVSNMEDSSPFCSHEWIFRWAETFLGKNELQIILARKDGELVGFAPLYMTSYYGLRVLQLLGLKEVNGECVSFIIQHELEDVVAPDIFRAIIDLPTRWDAVSFYGIRSNSNMQRLLFVHGLPLMKETKCLTSLLGLARVVNLEGGWDKYLQTCSK